MHPITRRELGEFIDHYTTKYAQDQRTVREEDLVSISGRSKGDYLSVVCWNDRTGEFLVSRGCPLAYATRHEMLDHYTAEHALQSIKDARDEK